jgi:hypothetical protein
MTPTFKAPGTKSLKLEYDNMLSILLQFCFQIQVRRYTKGVASPPAPVDHADLSDLSGFSTSYGSALSTLNESVKSAMGFLRETVKAGAYTRPLFSST